MVVELSRRFRELTEEEQKDPESLLLLAEAGLLKSMSWDDVLRHRRVVLLAEAGSGKTVEMRERSKRLHDEGKPAFFLPLEALDAASVSDLLDRNDEKAFKAWLADDQRSAWLFLDAVDELKLTRGRLERALGRVAKEIDGCLHRVHIVISCRPTDWRPFFDLAVLQRAFPTTPTPMRAPDPEDSFLSVLRARERTKKSDEAADEPRRDDITFVVLLPLDQPQIEAFATALHINDVDSFIAELRRQDAWRFARRPLDLAELITSWKAYGRLGTRAEQHEANVVVRLRDDPERRDAGVLSDADAREGAERLALALALTHTRTIRAPELSSDVEHLSGVLDSSQILVDWSEERRQSLLRRAIFDPATYGRVRFHHRSVQEYLAACRLKTLRQAGMSTKALTRLLFAERYGVAVVIPSMRPIAAWLSVWDAHVRRELTRREAETLLSMGDPESLSLDARAELLRAFVRTYGSGGWRGLHIPLDDVRRLAHPELASVVRELWTQASTNDDVRELLLDLIEQGTMRECIDVCEQTAHNASLAEHHRYAAIRALMGCGHDAAVRDIAHSIVSDLEKWPLTLVAQLLDDLFPQFITAADVVRFVGMRAREAVRTRFGESLRRIASTVSPLSPAATELRDRLADLLLQGGVHDDDEPEDGPLDHVGPALAILCHRQLGATGSAAADDSLLRASAVASRSASTRRGNERIADLRQRFGHDADLRSRAFWVEVALVEPLRSDGEDPWRRLRRVQRNGLLGDFGEHDRNWLRAAAVDASDASRRALAVQSLILLWVQQGRAEAGVAKLLNMVRDDTNLTGLVEAWSRPPESDPTIERFNERERGRRAEAAVAEQQRLSEWSAWRERLVSDPIGAFSPSNQFETMRILYSWLDMRERENDRRNAWNYGALQSSFGNDVATRAREAFRAFWRTQDPVLRSRRRPEERNSVLYSWIYALCGIAAEAETAGWASRLGGDEAKRAAALALIEINGLPAWVRELANAHPADVESVLGAELEAEIDVAATPEFLPVLQSLTYADSALKELLAPRLARRIVTWPHLFSGAEGASSSARNLEQVIRILEAANGADVSKVADICEERFKSDPAGPLGLVWLKGLFGFFPRRGVKALENALASIQVQERGSMAVAAFGAMFGLHGGVALDVSIPSERAEIVGALLRMAYEFIRPEDDQQHEGVYTPNARDEAEKARGLLLSALLDTSGPETQRILLALAADPLLVQYPDRLRLLARDRAAKDAEHAAFTTADVVALDRRHEVAPSDRDGLFELMVDRVDDLAADIASHDFSDRRTLQTITDEAEMQRTLAYRLEGMARGAYTVTRESEVADAKRTDIRFAAVRGEQKATIEIKITDKGWSVRELERALKDQLVGQYLRHATCKAGCLLLTYSGQKKYWESPESSLPMTFEELIAHLTAVARTIEEESGHECRLAVRGLDLRDVRSSSPTQPTT